MKKQNTLPSLTQIYKELEELHSLYKIQHEALYTCYETNQDYGHIFAFDTVYLEKSEGILNKLKSLAIV